MKLFTIILVLPWVLDVVGGRLINLTLFGAFIWGAMCLFAFLHDQSRDLKLKASLRMLLLGSSIVWIAFWLCELFIKKSINFSTADLPLLLLTRVHAVLLSIGAAMVLVLLLAAIIWMLRDYMIVRARGYRGANKSYLPSLESLSKSTWWSLSAALFFWGHGLTLALVTAYFRWKVNSEKKIGYWLMDQKVLLCIFLFALLLFQYWLTKRFEGKQKDRKKITVVLSLVFLVVFIFLLQASSSKFHMPTSWFKL